MTRIFSHRKSSIINTVKARLCGLAVKRPQCALSLNGYSLAGVQSSYKPNNLCQDYE